MGFDADRAEDAYLDWLCTATPKEVERLHRSLEHMSKKTLTFIVSDISKRGNFFSLIDGTQSESTDKFIGTGTADPAELAGGIEIGDKVKGQFKKNDAGYWGLVETNIKIVEKAAGPTEAPKRGAPPRGRKGGGGGGRGDSPEKRASIEYQACLKAAADIGSALGVAGLLGAKTKTAALVVDFTREAAYAFFQDVQAGKRVDELEGVFPMVGGEGLGTKPTKVEKAAVDQDDDDGDWGDDGDDEWDE